jgi:cytoskeleton protein RodZ
MSNLFDNTDNTDGKKAEQDSAQKRDDAVFLTERELPDPSPLSKNWNPSEPLENRTLPDSEPEISQFLKNQANAETRDTDKDTLDAASVVQGVGHMLRHAREARNMSIEEVSRQLRISVHQVEAIEKEDFDTLPGRTFVRGFVRNYANLMHLDANAAVRMLPGLLTTATHASHASHAEQTPFKIQEMATSSRERQGSGYFLRIIVLLIALAAVGFFLYDKLPLWLTAEENVPEKERVVQRSDDQATVELQLALPALKLSTGPVGTTLPNSGASTSESIVTQLPLANLNTVATLFFNFTADTHVKVIDGNDDVIFDQQNARGTQQRVSGKRPLSVSIGKASAVELNYNDRAVDINPYTHPTRGSAHLMLE